MSIDFSLNPSPAAPEQVTPELSAVCHGYCRRSPINETLFGESDGLYVYVSYWLPLIRNPPPDAGGEGEWLAQL